MLERGVFSGRIASGSSSKVFFQIVCFSNQPWNHLTGPRKSRIASSLALSHSLTHTPTLPLSRSLFYTHTHIHTLLLYQHCLYLLYRSVRRAVRENTRGRGERQSILQERKSTGVDGAPGCVCVSASLIAVMSLTYTDHLFRKTNIFNNYSHVWLWMHSCVKTYASIYPTICKIP